MGALELIQDRELMVLVLLPNLVEKKMVLRYLILALQFHQDHQEVRESQNLHHRLLHHRHRTMVAHYQRRHLQHIPDLLYRLLHLKEFGSYYHHPIRQFLHLVMVLTDHYVLLYHHQLR
tara:strand:+ start:1278 stop:1634 length:357 start_codon:yes stop_codon:yes gene_type:complete